jgi:phage terminase large subunit-like protein
MTTTRGTRSRSKPDARALGLSPEVAYYLAERGIPLPDRPPKWRTPEPSGRGVKFDPSRVDRVLRAFAVLQHTQGRWAGRPLKPDPWEIAYILAPTYGWVRKDATTGEWVRVIRTQYVELPRKNGKTTLAGAQAMYLTAADREQGAQVVAAAASRDQASFCFDPVKRIAEMSPGLGRHVEVRTRRIIHRPSGSYFTVIASMADLIHGANIHGAVIDELHVHKTRDLVDALETGTGARAQPLAIIITTADDGKPGTIYAEKRDYAEKLARRVLKDPTFYGVIWAADADDDPFAEETWIKANPGYGVSPTKSFMQAEARKAAQSPANRARFLRLHLGIRTKQETRYVDMPVWDRNASIVDEARMVGREAYGGLDLANTSDLCALAWDFPSDDGSHDVLWRFWLPERGFRRLDESTAGQARVWRDRGLITITPGDVTDYEWIKAQVNRDREAFDVREIAYDPWNASQLVNDLTAAEAPMVKLRQGFVSMSPPTKQLLHLLLEGTAAAPRYRHGGNPVMRWMVDNLAVATDPAGNVKPDRARAAEKIDGVVAAIMALDRAINRPEKRVSAYEDSGLKVV